MLSPWLRCRNTFQPPSLEAATSYCPGEDGEIILCCGKASQGTRLGLLLQDPRK